MKKKKIVIGSSVGIAILIIAFVLLKSCSSSEQKIGLETAKVTRGKISNTVTATGTIEAIKTVSVGTQVSGDIKKIYVDYNSYVKAGDLLAELDTRSLKSNLEISQASLDDAQAEVNYQTATYERTKALHNKNLVAQSDYDEVVYNYEKAKAALKTAQLNYDKAKINLGYALIYSPINGIVLNRAVDEGQTVAASFSTPTLFTIANDLTRMQVEASIDEADIGQIKNGQKVLFTVDAFPDMTFKGTVTQIRLEPVTTSNVVTYTVIVEAPNPDMKLMPGMTASITIYVTEAENVLTIPSKALRFKPDEATILAYMPKAPKENGPKPDSNSGPTKTAPEGNTPNDSLNLHEVWVKNGNVIFPVMIKTGLDDDINVEVTSGLRENDEVIISATASATTTSATTGAASSPFMPKPPSRKSK